MMNLFEFYRGKNVLITGHTGFKGSWLCHVLIMAGANVTGYALEPVETPNLFGISHIKDKINSVYGDIRDYDKLSKVFDDSQPEIVFHLAAQPLVLESYRQPRYTYEVNVMGTVNVCECIRNHKCVKSFLNITTDKVYQNKEWIWGYREEEALDGYDPYSNSKSCSELVTHSYINSFFRDLNISASTARAGNVIGGGDFAKDRIIPDCIRAMENKEEIVVRNPNSVRPYQHVLEPLGAYLMIAQKQYEDFRFAGFYNVGPNEEDCITTGNLVDLFCQKWGEDAKWKCYDRNGLHEARFLKLDCSKLKTVFGWKPKWNIEAAIEKTVAWSRAYLNAEGIEQCMSRQIKEFFQIIEG